MERHWGEKSPKKTSVNSSGKSEKHISVHENKIYYYSSVNRDSAVELNKKIGEIESKSLTLCNTLDLDQPPTCRIYINSGGGSVTRGLVGSSASFTGGSNATFGGTWRCFQSPKTGSFTTGSGQNAQTRYYSIPGLFQRVS